MIEVGYTASFLRRYKKLDIPTQQEARVAIEKFKDRKNHSVLKVHKLSGVLTGKLSFSINFSDRIIFEWSKDKKTAYFLDIGDHGIYE